MMDPIFEKARELDTILMIHAGGSEEARPIYIAEIAERFPDVTVIIEHGVSYEAIYFAKKVKNLIIDTRGALGPNTLKWAVESVGADRVTSGSDWPLDQGPFGGIVLNMKIKWDLSKISDEDKCLVLGENMARILNIK